MSEYIKIQTIFKRDSNNVIIPGDYTLPEFKALENLKWEATEKIDGTNMRIEIEWLEENKWELTYGGKTDNAQIPPHLDKKMHEKFDNLKVNEVFSWKEPCHITIFGEGYGVKIQKGGNYISNDCDFILFDVKIGEWWLEREALEDIANKMNIDIVPLMGYFTIPEAIARVSNGFKSTIAENPDYDAEGFVLKAPCGLLTRGGKRLMTKIKTKDFRDYVRHYPDKERDLDTYIVRKVCGMDC